MKYSNEVSLNLFVDVGISSAFLRGFGLPRTTIQLNYALCWALHDDKKS